MKSETHRVLTTFTNICELGCNIDAIHQFPHSSSLALFQTETQISRSLDTIHFKLPNRTYHSAFVRKASSSRHMPSTETWIIRQQSSNSDFLSSIITFAFVIVPPAIVTHSFPTLSLLSIPTAMLQSWEIPIFTIGNTGYAILTPWL